MPKNVTAEKREPFSSTFEHLTSTCTVFWRKKHGAWVWGWKSGIGGDCNLQTLSLLPDTPGVNNLAPILLWLWKDHKQRAGAGQMSFSSQPKDAYQRPLKSAVPAQSAVTSVYWRGAKSHLSTKEIRAIVVVYCVAKRCQNSPLALRVVFRFTCSVFIVSVDSVFLKVCSYEDVSYPAESQAIAVGTVFSPVWCVWLAFELEITTSYPSLQGKAKNSSLLST